MVQPSPIVSHLCDSNSDLNLQLVVFNCGITFLLYYRKMLLWVLVYHIRHYLQFDMNIAMVCQNFENKSVSISSTMLVVIT